MPTAQVNGITVNYQVDGADTGEWVVLVNGLADDLETWEPQIQPLTAAGYRILRYDNRGIGRTSRPRGPYTADLLANDLYGLLKHLDIKRCHLLGISMGGMILQSYALQYPNGKDNPQMLSLTLACTYSSPGPFCSRMFHLWSDMSQRMSVGDVMRDVLLWCFTPDFFSSRAEDVKEIDKAMAILDLTTEQYLDQLNVITEFNKETEIANTYGSGKTLGGLEAHKIAVLWGEQDILIPAARSIKLADYLPGSTRIPVKGGHGCSMEFAESFNSAYIFFIQSLDRT